MIVAGLEIEDFKQFAGTHRFCPAESGIVGVIGANGVGKTTLFEAIEWCLYQPREITAEEVRPRGRSSKPRVKLTLADPATGVRYVVERELKKSGANADLYRDDEPESRIVHGSRQVTEYVARSLIGLSHRAFVSTFFTRQKELTFFGALRETERRREVGRLLGFETIRAAQYKIGQDRTAAGNEAKVLLAQHAEQSEGRDFLAETSEAELAVALRQCALDEANAALAGASEVLIKTRDDLARMRDLERQDAEVRRELERVAGDERTATAKRDAALGAIAELDRAAAQRTKLEPVAAAESARVAAVKEHEAGRDRHLEWRRLQQDLRRLQSGIDKVPADLRRAVAEANASRVAGWSIAMEDAADPVAAADRLVRVAEDVDATAAAQEATALATCFSLAQARERAEETFQKRDQLLKGLERQRAEVTAAGDPRLEATEALRTRDAALRTKQEAVSNAENARRTRDELAPIVTGLKSKKFEGRCPTCGRPFSEHEAGITLAALEDHMEDLAARIARMDEQRKRAEGEASASDKRRQDAEQRQRELATLDGRISDGRPIVDEARRLFDEAVRECADALAELGMGDAPTKGRVDEARVRAETLGRVAQTLSLLRQLRSTAQQHVIDRATVSQSLAELGEVAYDESAHREADKALQEARAAAAQIARIDLELARRPQLVEEADAASADLSRLAGERAARDGELAAIGFDRSALDLAVAAEQTALQAERDALTARADADAGLKDAGAALKALLVDQQRIAGLLDRSDARQREADVLDQMYREFTLFDQYVAGVVTPQLAEHTERLLAAVTDGKYDRVDFDDNYGVLVFDGDEKFPMEEFSGGERDVIALCARLALSQMIGDQAANPPGFLVLDEVFGSLDRDRRAQVLETLNAIAGTAEAFQQLFIISHVDDVRFSPVFSEIWRVAETSEGASRLENLNLTGGAEEL
ncbi:MAG: AAA family ATPase [Thermomicrobiales bacterium]